MAIKENPSVTLPLKHQTDEFVGCLIPRFISFFRLIVVAKREREIEWNNMSPISIHRDIAPAKQITCAGRLHCSSVSIFLCVAFLPLSSSNVFALTPAGNSIDKFSYSLISRKWKFFNFLLKCNALWPLTTLYIRHYGMHWHVDFSLGFLVKIWFRQVVCCNKWIMSSTKLHQWYHSISNEKVLLNFLKGMMSTNFQRFKSREGGGGGGGGGNGSCSGIYIYIHI